MPLKSSLFYFLFAISKELLVGFLEAVHWFVCRGFGLHFVPQCKRSRYKMGVLERKLDGVTV